MLNKAICILFVVLGFSINLFAQNSTIKKKQLEEKRFELLREIDFTRKQLNDIRKQAKVNMSRLNLLKEQIVNREKMIVNINDELSVLSSEITSTENVVSSLQNDLDKYRKEYAAMVQEAYKNKSNTQPFLFIVTAESFNQAWKRLRYLQDYRTFREKQGRLISQTQESLAQKINILQSKKHEKESLKGQEITQKNLLQVESEKKNKVVIELKKDEKKLLADLKSKSAANDRLNKAIEDVIRKEIAEARALAKSKKPTSISKEDSKPELSSPNKSEPLLSSTPEALALSSSFESNKGRLPWPVSRGFITQEYGEHFHPVLKNVKVKNNGINIKTQSTEKVKAIFKGEVTGIVTIPGMQRVIIIRHGGYLSVYAHLKDVFVKLGQNVDSKQEIGSVFSDDENNETEVHLEIWKGTNKLDPQIWILAK